MAALIKSIGKGILYIIALPFFLLVLALTAVFGVFILLFMFIKSIIFFFTGRSLNDDLEEDRKAKEIKEGKKPEKPQPQKEVEERPVVEPYKEEVIKEEPIIVPIKEEPVIKPIEEPTPKPVITPIEREVFVEKEQPVIVETPKQEEVIKKDEPIIQINPIDELEEEPIISENRPIESIDVNPTPAPKKETPIGQYVPHTGGAGIIEEIEEEEESDVIVSFGEEDD